MSGDKVKGKWKSGAWTPDRCAAWRALSDDMKTKFEGWVSAELPFGYDVQVSAEFKVEG